MPVSCRKSIPGQKGKQKTLKRLAGCVTCSRGFKTPKSKTCFIASIFRVALLIKTGKYSI